MYYHNINVSVSFHLKTLEMWMYMCMYDNKVDSIKLQSENKSS